MRHALIPLLLGLALLLLARTTSAQKYNLTSSTKAPLVAGNQPPGVACDLPGICSPVNPTIPGRTLWYWCGFSTTHRTTYKVSALNKSKTIDTMYMMREKELRECALPNVSFVAENCVSIPESSCSSKSSCDVRMFGLVFPDDECFVIINKGSSPLSITIRLNNFFDRPRYYGTVFTLFFGVVGSLAILANVAWQFYTIIIAPVNRHHEPVKVKRDDPVKRRDDVESDSSASATATGASAVRAAWYQKIMSKLRPTQVANGHIA